MELKQVYYFELVYELKSISKAADRLYMSQQGVSKQITKLEKELGIPLFSRNSKGVEPTDSGQYFHEQAVKMLNIRQDISRHFDMSSSQDNRLLRIAVSHEVGSFFSDEGFDRFTVEHRGIALQTESLWSARVDEQIMSGEIDAGITIEPVRSDELELCHILKKPLLCIVNTGNPLAEKEHVTLEELLRYKIAIIDENSNSFYGFDEVCRRKKVSPDLVKMLDLLSIYEYVDQHDDSAAFTLDAYSAKIRYPNIKVLTMDDSDAAWDICLAWKKGNESGDIKELASYLKGFAEGE